MLYVQVTKKKSPRVCVLQMAAGSQREAEQIQSGVKINLNHDNFKVVF